MSESYLDVIKSQWENILNLYLQFEEHRPVMLFDMDKNEIFAMPYEDFKGELNKKSQEALETQYQRAIENEHMVVFVKDDAQNNMLSYSLKIYEEQ